MSTGISASVSPPPSPDLSDLDDTVVIGYGDIKDYNPRQVLPETPDMIRTLQNWLQPTAYDRDTGEYRKHLASHLDGTGSWLTSTKAYQSWLYGDSHGMLWLKGAPGSGKSVMAAKLIQDLSRSQQPVVYFFFRQIIDANREPIALLRDWLAQILVYSPPLQRQLKTYMEGSRSLDSLSAEDLWRNLRLAFDSLPCKVFCIADALDEIDGSLDGFLTSMADLGQRKPDKVKVLLTSRPVPSIESALTSTGCRPLQVRLAEHAVDLDISAFVADGLRASRLSPEEQNIVKQAIPGRANGLFLYAKLAMDAVLHPDAPGRITDVLSSLPYSLNDMYTTLLRDHMSRSGVAGNIQLLVLQCATHSTRPLRLIEIADMINVTDGSFGYADVKAAKEVVRRACGPFLEILPDESVSVVHHSFTEYLKGWSRVPGGEDFGYPVLLPGGTHAKLALVCLSYLQKGCLDQIDTDTDVDDFGYIAAWNSNAADLDTLLRYPFLQYAAHNWHIHAARSARAGGDQSEIKEALDSFLGNQKRLMAYARVSGTAMGRGATRLTRLHVAARTGLAPYVEYLLEPNRRTVEVDACDGEGKTALWWAASAGYADMIRRLVRAGADANHDGSKCGLRPIHEAARKGHYEAVRALLDAGVDPMTASALSDHTMSFRGSFVAANDTALMYACRNGHVETADILLSHTNDIDTVHQALVWAVDGQSSRLVQKILESPGVDVNTKVHGVTPIFVACSTFDDVEIVNLLLSAGADPNICITDNYDELQFLEWNSHPEVSISWDTKDSKDDARGRTPLLQFCSVFEWGLGRRNADTSEAMFRTLVRAGANIHQRDKSGRTALHGAASSGCLTRLLLEAGADPNAADDRGETPLHFSTSREVITLLIRHGADINTRDTYEGRTALMRQIPLVRHAAMPNDEGLITLLENGADCNQLDSRGDSALHLALDSGDSEISTIKLLLDAGADPNLRNKAGETPLHRATETFLEAGIAVIDLLLAAGADINARDSNGATLLFRMASDKSLYGDEGKPYADMDDLRSRGASITVRDNAGRTVLHEAIKSYNSYYQQTSSRSDVEPSTPLDYFLGQGFDARVVDDAGNNLLHAIASEVQTHCSVPGVADPTRVWRKLVSLGIDPSQTNKKGRTALHVLCCQSHDLNFSIYHKYLPINYLIPLMRNSIDAADNEGFTALHLAATVGECYTKKLLDAGADPTAVTREGLTPLHLAARARLGNNVGLLLDALYAVGQGDKADARRPTGLPGSWIREETSSTVSGVNAKDMAGRTPLWYACRSGWPDTVSLLVKAGARLRGEGLFQACAEVEEEQDFWRVAWHEFPGWQEDQSGGLRLEDTHRPAVRDREWHVLETRPSFGHDRDRLEEILALLADAGADLSELELLDLDTHVTDEVGDGISKGYALSSLRDLREMHRTNSMRIDDNLDPESYVSLHKRHLLRILGDLGFKSADAGTTHSHETHSNMADERGWSVSDLLSVVRREQPSMEIVRCLVESFDVDVNAVATDEENGSVHCAILELARGRHWWQAALALPYLLDHGADHRVRGRNGMTALHVSLASSTNSMGTFQRDAARALLFGGADPNAVDDEGRHCLSYAAEVDAALVQLVVDHGARIGPDALFAAIDGGNLSALEVLLRAGAGANCRMDALEKKKRRWKADKGFGIVSDEDIKDHEWYPVHYAAAHRSHSERIDSERVAAERTAAARMVELLLAHGAEPFATFRSTAVNMSRSDIDEDMVDVSSLESLDNGKGKTARLYEEVSVLHEVIMNRGIVRPFLLLPDLDLNHRDPSGRTILHAACASQDGPDTLLLQANTASAEDGAGGPSSIMSYLLSRGADPISVDKAGRNALHHVFAQRSRHSRDPLPTPAVTKTTEQLSKSYPALVSQRDRAGRTPLLAALSCVAQARDEPTGKEFARAANILLDIGGADPTATDGQGNTALHILAPRLHDSIARGLFQLLLALHGLDVNARNAKGETPAFAFLVAATAGRFRTPERRDAAAGFAVLRAAGADLLARDAHGRGLLHVAARTQRFSRRGRSNRRVGWPAFRTLWKLGLDPLAEDGERRTALDVAAASGNNEVLVLFEKGGAAEGAEEAESSGESEEDESLT